MKNAAPCLAVLMIFALLGTPSFAETKVFLLAGQSNMAGVGGYSGYIAPNSYPWTMPPYGQGPDAPCPSPYNMLNPHVKFWNYATDLNPNGAEIMAGVGTGWTNLQQGYGALKTYPGSSVNYGPQFGPELSFGAKLHDLYPNDQIYLVKYALSSTALADRWSPTGGDCYNSLISRVNAAMANLTTAGKNPTIAGMIWMQGEDDSTNHAYSVNYASNLKNLINTVRDTYDAPDMKFVAGRITTMTVGAGWASAGDCDLVRNAQWNISSQVSNASCINTDDLEWAYYGHYGTQGQIDLGIRFANEFAPVPEPSTLVLVCTAAFGLLGYRRWRRSSRDI